MKTILPFLCILGLSVTLAAQLPSEAEPLEKEYQAALRSLDTERSQQQQTLATGYLQALQRQRDAYQAEGDLDGILATDAERKRFEASSAAPSAAELSSFDAVRTLQTQLAQALNSIEQQQREKRQGLGATYMQQLEGLVTQLTQESKIEEAIAVRSYHQSLKQSMEGPRSPAQPQQQQPSPPAALANGDLQFQGKRYRIIDEQLSWTEARQAARAAGGDLVVLRSKEEHDALMKALDGRRAWIGAIIPPGGKEAKWVDGSPLNPIKGVRYRNNGKKDVNQHMTITPDNLMDDYHDTRTDRIQAYIIQF